MTTTKAFDVKKLTAEFLGTALLVLGICAAVIRSETNQITFFGIAVAHVIILASLIYAFGGISGGHFNPAVTIQFLVFGKIGVRESVGYMIAQFLGGIVGAVALTLTMGEVGWNLTNSEDVGTKLAANTVFEGHGIVAGIVAELLMTALLVLSIWISAVNEETKSNYANWIIGGTLGAGVYVIGPVTNNSLNPARALGPAVALCNYNADLVVFFIGPILGGLLGAFLNKVLYASGKGASNEQALVEEVENV